MSSALQVARAETAPAVAARPPASLGRADAPARARRLATRLGNEWLPRAVWTISRTGRAGLVGIALLLAAALFFFSTHLEVAAEVETLRAELARTQGRVRPVPAEKVAAPSTAVRALPARGDMPAIVRDLFSLAVQSRLTVDTARYEVNTTRSSGVVRYHIAFPVKGPYPRIRAFIDATLATMPAVALSELVLERKSIGDGNVEAQIRMTAYTGEDGAPAARAPEARSAKDRVVAPTHASALFAQHTWHVVVPVKAAPPPPPPAPPEPTAPPLPYTFLGSYVRDGSPPVFILSRGDRLIETHVGDRLDGVYQLESAAGGQLVFVYLPLNIRQNLAAGASK